LISFDLLCFDRLIEQSTTRRITKAADRYWHNPSTSALQFCTSLSTTLHYTYRPIHKQPKRYTPYVYNGTSYHYYLLITKGPTGHLQCYTKTQKYNKTQW